MIANKMQPTNEVLTDVYVLVRDAHGWADGTVHEDLALTVIGIASEDPDDWEDLRRHWPRYRTPPVPESFPDDQLTRCQRQPTLQAAQQASGWVLVDLELRRLQTGGKFQRIERTALYDMGEEGCERPQRDWPLPVCLPPWWEIDQHVDLPQGWDSVPPRKAPLNRPRANRRVLYGRALYEDLAGRITALADGAEWRDQSPSTAGECYRWIVDMHRDWLMTPREDLDGRTPRDQLHGAHEWLDQLFQYHRTRAQEQKRLVARPVPALLEDGSPMGREEVCEYFSFCRAILEAGVEWVIAAKGHDTLDEVPGKLSRALTVAMENAGQQWLASTDEDGLKRHLGREAARRRMPLAWGVPVDGMEDVPAKLTRNAQIARDPLSTFEDALFSSPNSITFLCYDGSHLDYDQEFAFSLCNDYEEWQWMYGERQDSA